MGIKALGWVITICHPCSSHSVTVHSSGQCGHSGNWFMSHSNSWLLQIGQFNTSVSSQKEEGVGGWRWKATKEKGGKSERAGGGGGGGWMTLGTTLSSCPLSVCPLVTPSHSTNIGLFSEPIPDITWPPRKSRLPLRTPCLSPESCESCPGSS